MDMLSFRVLQECENFDQTDWRKTPDQLLKEIQTGDCNVEFEPNFRRIVSVGYCVIRRADGKLLKEISNTRKSDGRIWNRLQDAGGKLQKVETSADATRETIREISEELGIPIEKLQLELENGNLKYIRREATGSENGTGSAYPGIPAIWHNYWHKWDMPDEFVKDQYIEEDNHKVCVFGWVDPPEA
jgi:hypothetical protein